MERREEGDLWCSVCVLDPECTESCVTLKTFNEKGKKEERTGQRTTTNLKKYQLLAKYIVII